MASLDRTAINRNHVPRSAEADALGQRINAVIPGGSHTYAKGDDQWPACAPALIERGQGARVWDTDGNEFLEYAPGSRAVTLGHAYPPVVEAVVRQLALGVNFTRPARIELEAAEALLALLPAADMVKFTKDGSTATSAALKLARAHTGRDMVALCSDHPFFSYDDWFITTTQMDAGIPGSIAELTVGFPYNDIAALEALFAEHPDRIACVILEPEKGAPPQDRFLHRVQELCAREGAVFVLDEMQTGFRHAIGGAQTMYDLTPDLSTFGKALANGFSVSALAGRRELMELGGLHHDRERVFLLSTTHGGETHALAAAMEVMRIYQEEPVIETLRARGEQLRDGVNAVARQRGLEACVQAVGHPANLVFATRDGEGRPSQHLRALFMQELIRRGILATSFVVTYSHTEQDIERTVEAVDGALEVYAQALEHGVDGLLDGPPTQIVYRRFN